MRTQTHRELERFMRIAKFRTRLYKILRCKEERGVLDLETVEEFTEKIEECDSFILNHKRQFGFKPFQRIII